MSADSMIETQAGGVRSANPALQVCWEETSTSADWDAFVESSADGHHEQTSLWGRVRSRQGWQIERLIVRDGSVIVAGAQLMIRSLGCVGKYGYVTYGPIFGREDPELTKLVLKELQSHANFFGIRFLVVGLPYEAHKLTTPLLRAGFIRKPTKFPPNFIEATCVIDLRKSLDEILSRMRPHTRRNIRFATKRGIRVVEGTAQDLTAFRRLMVSLCERRGTIPNPPQSDFFDHLWEEFHQKGWIKLLIAMKENEPVAGALAFPFGDYLRVWKVGWSGLHGRLQPNEALWWEAIQWAKAHSFRYFDFVEIDIETARTLAAGGQKEKGPMNVTSFKLGFGGEVKVLPGAYCYAPNFAIRSALRWGLMPLLAQPALVNVGKSMWRRAQKP